MEEILNNKINKYFINRTIFGNGILDDKSIIISDNDYLSISNNEYVNYKQIENLKKNIKENKELISSIMFISNCNNINVEKRLAEYIKKESCMLTQSGYVANSGILQALCDKNTNIYIDEKDHASFINGIYHSKCKHYIFKHNNIKHLEKLIIDNGYGFIVIDSLYSGYGTFSPLLEICKLKKIQLHAYFR